MIFRFGPFELDPPKRELRLQGRPVDIQPRVFDVFAHLLHHRERVVSKDELLEAVWPDVIVTDSSIMRALSVIRSILRRGGVPNAIQTFSRQGYRFIGKLETDGESAPGGAAAENARSAAKNGDWSGAFEAYASLKNADGLSASDYEQWANAALCVGKPNAAIRPLELAVAGHSRDGNPIGAARAALTLTNVNLEARALAIAKGWHRRAQAFLAEERTETREHGLCVWLTARIAMFEGDLPRALEYAKSAEALARRVKDPDVEALGLIYRGHVELATGAIRTGLVHMDEAGAAVLSGSVGTWVSGVVFCSIIWAYLDRGDLGRAGQWTDEFTRWSQRHTGFGFPGLCRLHRGEVLCAQGELVAAEAEIERARELLAESARYAEGDAWRVLGEIRLLRGEFAEAETAFRQAHELGWNPIPGWALLQAERGESAAALKVLQRALQMPTWADGQRRGLILAHAASIAARSGKKTAAKKFLAELTKATSLRSASGCEAGYQQARGEVAFADDECEKALRYLRGALEIWMNAGARINVAHTRLRLAEMLISCGDRNEAELELAAAEKAFVKMDAQAMVARCRETGRRLHAR